MHVTADEKLRKKPTTLFHSFHFLLSSVGDCRIVTSSRHPKTYKD